MRYSSNSPTSILLTLSRDKKQLSSIKEILDSFGSNEDKINALEIIAKDPAILDKEGKEKIIARKIKLDHFFISNFCSICELITSSALAFAVLCSMWYLCYMLQTFIKLNEYIFLQLIFVGDGFMLSTARSNPV